MPTLTSQNPFILLPIKINRKLLVFMAIFAPEQKFKKKSL